MRPAACDASEINTKGTTTGCLPQSSRIQQKRPHAEGEYCPRRDSQALHDRHLLVFVRRLFHVARFLKTYRSTTTSLVGLEQHSSACPASISRWRMPPACFISTVPEISLLLQVPHRPLVQDDGRRMPAARAAVRMLVSAAHSTTRPVLANSIR